jgi:hypothetical protein
MSYSFQQQKQEITMEIIEKIQFDIFQLLALNPDKFRSITSLYNEYNKKKLRDDENYIPIDRTVFCTSCYDIDNCYNNIKKTGNLGNYKLALITNDSVLEESLNDNNKLKEDYANITPIDIINFYVNNPEFSSPNIFNELVNDTDPMLHYVCRNGKPEMIEKLLNSYDFDLSIKNKNNEEIYDVINFENDFRNGVKIAKLITNYQMNKYKLLRLSTEDQLKKDNTLLINQNIKYKNDVKKLEKYFYILCIIYGCIMAICVGLVYNHIK